MTLKFRFDTSPCRIGRPSVFCACCTCMIETTDIFSFRLYKVCPFVSLTNDKTRTHKRFNCCHPDTSDLSIIIITKLKKLKRKKINDSLISIQYITNDCALYSLISPKCSHNSCHCNTYCKFFPLHSNNAFPITYGRTRPLSSFSM